MKLTDFFGLLGGLALFLYGMQMMSSGLEAAAGNKMKRILERLTANRFLGRPGRSGSDSRDPVVIGNHGYGSRICKFGHDDTETGCMDHHGCKYRYDNYRTADCA